MKHKSEAPNIYRQWRSDIQTYFRQEPGGETFTSEALEYLRSDNGGEFIGTCFRNQLQSDGAQHETSAPDTPEQNGLAERMNQTLSTLANTMLEESKLPKSFWADAMATAAYVTAQSPANGINGKTPYEVLFNRHVDPTIFWSFGCPAYALVPKDKRSGKFHPHARKGIMIGYTHGQHAYKLLDLQKCTVISSRHVRFNETETLDPFETTPWAANPTGNQWEGLTPARLHTKLDPTPTDDDEEDQGPPKPAEPVGAVGGHQPPPPPEPEPEPVGAQRPQTPEALDLHAEPWTPPQQILPCPRSPPPHQRRSA